MRKFAPVIALVAVLIIPAYNSTLGLAASANTTVSVTVASATNIDGSACLSDVSNVTNMGIVLPGSSTVTSSDCSITFGSSNDTSMLRISQQDANGAALWTSGTGTLAGGFGTAGVTSTPVLAGDDVGSSVAVQADGKIVVIGYVWTGTTYDMGAVRYNTNGTLDATFGTGGTVDLPVTNDTGQTGQDVLIQPDGKIVVMFSQSGAACFLIRLTTTGALDTTFGTSGFAATGTSQAMAQQSDGKLLVAGFSANLDVQRFTANGAVDTSFGTAGTVSTNVGVNPRVGGLAVQPDGKILVAGSVGAPSTMLLARYTTAGTLDGTFGTSGVTTALPGGISAGAATPLIQADGRIVVVGTYNDGTWNGMAFARFSTVGVLDATYGTAGFVTLAGAGFLGTHCDYRASGILQPDEMAVGICAFGGGPTVAARVTNTGALDTRFGTNGHLITANSFRGAKILQTVDGRHLIGGSYNNGTNWDFAAMEWESLTIADYSGGSTDWAAGSNMFGACLRSVSNGASAQWTINAACPASVGAYWNGIPSAATKVAYAAAAGTTAATASLRFGLRTSTSQPSGKYVAPITFDVLAPNI